MKTWILIFLGMAALDYTWARWASSMQKGSAMGSANWSVLITLINGWITLSFVKDPWLLIPMGLGAWLGTYISHADLRFWRRSQPVPAAEV